MGTSLVVQWIGICLPMRGTWVRPLAQEIPHASEQLSPCVTSTGAFVPRGTRAAPKFHGRGTRALTHQPLGQTAAQICGSQGDSEGGWETHVT